MRTFLLFLLSFLLHSAGAQTYFYINNITVVPSAPTVSDQIEIHVQGSLSSTAAFIQDVQYSIEGNTVHITIVAAVSGIGLDVLVPHTEIVQIGALPAGDYTVHFMGDNILDSAPEPEHDFTVTGGGTSACDSLQIVSVVYHAFSDSLIEVRLMNSGSEIFSYPGFILYNADGDTIAIETVDLFGIGGESTHRLVIHPDAELVDPTFTGTLELWTDFYDTLACTFQMEVVLCPPSCATIIPYVMNLGGAIVNNSFEYIIHDADGAVASGILELANEIQFDSDTICLPAGEYSMLVTPGPGQGGQPYGGVLSPGYFSGPQQPVTSPPIELEFDFYEPCIEIIELIEDDGNEETFRFSQFQGRLLIENLTQGPIGNIALIDIRGAELMSTISYTPSAQIQIGTLASGVYLLTISEMDGSLHHHKFVIER